MPSQVISHGQLICSDAPALECAFLNGDGSGVEKRLADHLCVIGPEEFDKPLPDALVVGVLELDVGWTFLSMSNPSSGRRHLPRTFHSVLPVQTINHPGKTPRF